MRRPLIAAAGILFLTAPVLAQEPGSGAGRYRITPSEEGFTRLDTETGAISRCGKRDGVWYCEPLAEADSGLERRLDGFVREVARLSDKVDTLSLRIESLARRLDAVAERTRSGAGPTAEEEARRSEEAFGLAEKVMRRFFDMVRDMKRADADPI